MDRNKRRVAIINSVANKSTGKICSGLLRHLNDSGIIAVFCYGYGEKIANSNMYRIDCKFERYFHVLCARITGYQGRYSTLATRRLINYLDEKKINTIYGVGLHGYYLNERMFFDYVAERKIDFVYVMTEEYAFYGKCGYSNKCSNYLRGCGQCPYLHEYPRSWFFDRTRELFAMKKRAYERIKDHSIFVGPEYTITEGKKSPLLRDIKTEIIDEAIDTDFYYPRNTNILRADLGISEETIVILCVAPSAYGKKGTKYFVELAKRFENDFKYIFVHVGYTGIKEGLPANYIPIGYISDQNTLAEFYSLGDLFVFPSLLDTMPNACLEALACGVPLLCFNTSGMPFLGDDSVLTLVEPKDVDAMEEVVKKTAKRTQKTTNICRQYAINRFSSKDYYCKLERILDRL